MGNQQPSPNFREGSETIPFGSSSEKIGTKCLAPRTGDDIVHALT